jgi:GNAT superfamily N-acetyltransferase
MVLTIRQAGIEDIEALNSLNDIGTSNWVAEFWDDRMPGGIVFVAEDENGISGVEGYMGGYNMLGPNGKVVTHRSERTLVHPRMRGKGVFSELVDACHKIASNQGSEFCWGATSAISAFERAGFKGYTHWRRYYFVPISPVLRVSFFPDVLKVVHGAYQYHRNRDYLGFLRLGGSIAAILPMGIFRKQKLQTRPVDWGEYECISALTITESQREFQDFTLPIRKEYLAWLGSRGVHVICAVVEDQDQTPIGCFAYKTIDSSALVLDFTCSSSSKMEIMLESMRFHLRNCPEIGGKLRAIIFALNIRNKFHKNFSKVLPSSKLYSPLLGSFVIRTSSLDLSIDELRINPIWLEL